MGPRPPEHPKSQPNPAMHSLVYSRVPFKDVSGRWSPRWKGLCSCEFATKDYTGKQRVFREHHEHKARELGWGCL